MRPLACLMPDPPNNAVWLKLGAAPGLCGSCKHPKLSQTQRRTVYRR
jgi:hypothetical protein